MPQPSKRRDSSFNDSQVSSLAHSRRDSLESIASGPLVLLEDDEADIALLASQTEDTLDDIKSQVSAPPPTGCSPLRAQQEASPCSSRT